MTKQIQTVEELRLTLGELCVDIASRAVRKQIESGIWEGLSVSDVKSIGIVAKHKLLSIEYTNYQPVNLEKFTTN